MTPSIDIPHPPGVLQPPGYANNIHNRPKPTTPTDNLIHSKTHLTLTTHNTAKNIDNLEAIILRHQQQGTDILCLQEIRTTPSLHSLLNIRTFRNVSSDKSNGTAIIIHSSLPPFVTQLKHDKVNGCLIAMDLTIPGYHTLRIIDVYKSDHTHLRHRLEKTIAALQQNQPCHIMLGDVNRYIQPSLDTANVKRNKYWPWLHNQVHTTKPTTTPTLIDLYRKDHPETKPWTHPANKEALVSHTHRPDTLFSFFQHHFQTFQHLHCHSQRYLRPWASPPTRLTYTTSHTIPFTTAPETKRKSNTLRPPVNPLTTGSPNTTTLSSNNPLNNLSS